MSAENVSGVFSAGGPVGDELVGLFIHKLQVALGPEHNPHRRTILGKRHLVFDPNSSWIKVERAADVDGERALQVEFLIETSGTWPTSTVETQIVRESEIDGFCGEIRTRARAAVEAAR